MALYINATATLERERVRFMTIYPTYCYRALEVGITAPDAAALIRGTFLAEWFVTTL